MAPRTEPLPPRRFSQPELLRIGVRVTGARPIRLRCAACGVEWTPGIGADGRIAERYWVCPACFPAAGE